MRAPYDGTLLHRAFEDGVEVETNGRQGRLRLESAGDLVLSTGHLVAADLCNTDIPLERALPPGKYPVVLSVFEMANDRRVAFARIEAAPGKPVKWKGVGENEVSAAILVDSGTAAFCDLEVAAKMTAPEVFEKTFQALHKQMFPTKNAADVRLSASAVVTEGGANVVSFGTGWGDGSYPLYFGFDEKGQILAVVADFGVLTSSVSR